MDSSLFLDAIFRLILLNCSLSAGLAQEILSSGFEIAVLFSSVRSFEESGLLNKGLAILGLEVLSWEGSGACSIIFSKSVFLFSRLFCFSSRRFSFSTCLNSLGVVISVSSFSGEEKLF